MKRVEEGGKEQEGESIVVAQGVEKEEGGRSGLWEVFRNQFEGKNDLPT